MKVISNLTTYRHRFPYNCPIEDEDGDIVIRISRTLRPSDIDDYITFDIDGLIEVYFTLSEALSVGTELISASEYKGGSLE